MKTILLSLSAASLMLVGSSCHTIIPINPNSGERDCGMLPKKPCCPAFDCQPCACKKVEVKPTK